jgi:hypothetical protein
MISSFPAMLNIGQQQVSHALPLAESLAYLSAVYTRAYLIGVRSNALSLIWAIRNPDMKTL